MAGGGITTEVLRGMTAQPNIHSPFRIVIVGGGTAGWMTASSLVQHFGSAIDLKLVESSEIGSVGVGEATIPTIRQFCRSLGLQDRDVMQATDATCKLGIQFNDWRCVGDSFIHPFGLYGQDAKGIQFHQYWSKLRKAGQAAPFEDYSLGVQLAKNKKFTFPAQNPPSTLSVFDWALHLDAGKFAAMLRSYAIEKGVEAIDAIVSDVALCEDSGDIRAVHIESGITLEADLYIDCSGFRSILLGEALGVSYQSWQHWLLCDSAQVVQVSAEKNLPSYTKVDAQQAGWQWKIPLQHRTGVGQVYAKDFIADAQVSESLDSNLQHYSRLSDGVRQLRFTPGRRERFWQNNCVAIGLSAGFLEPLESTSIALIQTAIEKIQTLITSFPVHSSMVDEFNETTALEYERVRDFIILHYKLNQRSDSDFWAYCQNMTLPDSLQHKMELFKASGYVVNYRWEMFHLPSWLAIFDGFGYWPESYDVRVDQFPAAMLQENFQRMRASIARTVADCPKHEEFIQDFCKA